MSLLQTVKAESNVQKASSTQTRVSLLSSKKMGLTQSSLIDGTRSALLVIKIIFLKLHLKLPYVQQGFG